MCQGVRDRTFGDHDDELYSITPSTNSMTNSKDILSNPTSENPSGFELPTLRPSTVSLVVKHLTISKKYEQTEAGWKQIHTIEAGGYPRKYHFNTSFERFNGPEYDRKYFFHVELTDDYDVWFWPRIYQVQEQERLQKIHELTEANGPEIDWKTIVDGARAFASRPPTVCLLTGNFYSYTLVVRVDTTVLTQIVSDVEAQRVSWLTLDIEWPLALIRKGNEEDRHYVVPHLPGNEFMRVYGYLHAVSSEEGDAPSQSDDHQTLMEPASTEKVSSSRNQTLSLIKGSIFGATVFVIFVLLLLKCS